MHRRIHAILTEPTPSSWYDRVVEIAFAACLAFMPFALGVVTPWSEELALISVAAVAFLMLLGLIARPKLPFVWNWSYLLVLAFIAVAVLQLVPLPASIVGALSPNTIAMRKELLGDLSPPPMDHVTLSFCPEMTRHDLTIVLICASVFVVCLNLYRSAAQLKRLFATLGIIGAAVVALALAQDVSASSEIYWQIPIPAGPVALGGPFVNRNNFAQFANMCVGATLALLLVHHREALQPDVPRRWRGEPSSLFRSPMTWVLGAVTIGTIVAVVLSLSRGGVISALAAMGFFVAVLTASKGSSRRGGVFALFGLVAFGFVLYFGFDAIYDRFAAKDTTTFGGRQVIFQAAFTAFLNFPLIGSGLGTHQFVYPMFERSSLGALATHVENEYIQLAEEMGVVGLVLMGGFVAVIAYQFLWNVRWNKSPVGAAAFGLGFALIAAMVHSLSDFGQHFPAIGCLSAAICAALINLTRLGRAANSMIAEGVLARRPTIRRQILGCATMALAVFALASRVPAADRARLAANHWKEVEGLDWDLASNQWNGSATEYSRLLGEASAAADLCPGNVRYRYALNSYRWHAVEQFDDPGSPIYEQFAARIVAELDQARVACPTYGPTYCLSGQIEHFVLKQPIGATHIRTGYRLAPDDRSCCFALGRLAANQGCWDESLEAFTKCLALDGAATQDILNVYLNQVDRPDLAIAVLHDNYAGLFQFAEQLKTRPPVSQKPDFADIARKQAIAALESAAAKPDAPLPALTAMADVAWQREDYTSAASLYRRIIQIDYANPQWHFQLAKALAKLDQGQSAYREARLCLRMRPKWVEASALVDELEKLPTVHTDPN